MARMPFAGWNRTANQTMFRRPATTKGFREVFVRAVWRQQRLVDIKQTLREIGAPPKRNTDILGVSPSDFPKMTRSLFDRLP